MADEPWGFAPFHYGRWALAANGWVWVPGPRMARPAYAPALVGWVGGTPGFRFSAGVGVGWFPLAPGEVFVPGYRVSRAYVNRVNLTNTTVNVTKVTNIYNSVAVSRNASGIAYVNRDVNGGVTVVSRDTFVNARPVAQNVMRVDPKELAAAPVSRTVAAEPVRTSVLGAGRPVSARPPAAVISRPVVAVRTPPPPPRPIEQRQTQAGGHLNQQALVRPAGASQPAAVNQTRPQQSSQEPSSQGGFRPFTPPGGNGQVKQMPQTQPRVYEQQGSSGEDRPEDRNGQVTNRDPQTGKRDFTPPQQQNSSQETHPLVKQTPPVQERSPQQEQQQAQKFSTWQQQRPAPAALPKESSRPPAAAPAPKEEKPAKK